MSFKSKQQRKTQQQPINKDIHKAKINHSLRSVTSGDQGDYTNESHRYSTTEVYDIIPGDQNRATSEAETKRKILTNNEKTKKQSPNKKKRGSLRKNAN